MIAKILKVQLFVLFFLTLVVCFTYYYYDVLPDNFFTITSSSNSFSNILYYSITFAALIEYYSGSWILISFVFFTLIYAFALSKRQLKSDILIVLTISLMIMSFFAYYIPTNLGRGLGYLVSTNVSTTALLFIFLSFFVLNLYLVFRDNFFMSVALCFKLIYKVRNKKEKLLSTNNRRSKYEIINFIKRCKDAPKVYFALNIVRLLRGKAEIKNLDDIDKRDNLLMDDVQPNPKFIKNISPKKPGEKINHNLVNPKKIQNNNKNYHQLVNVINTTTKDKLKNIGPDDNYFEEIINRIEDKLSEFKIDGQIINILKGPVVDTFELELGAGVKVSKVTSSSEDLSMALYGAPIRIVYPMRGKTTVGIEVPRNPREIIYLDEILSSKDFINTKYDLPLAMGKDAFGEPFTVDLAAMPHMLVAGSTGSGKSVFVNTLLVSLLIKKSPEQMKLILIDPKQLELSLYGNLPHLLLPVVTEAKVASLALAWAVKEMDRRYSIMKEFQVRSLKAFNEKLKMATPEMLSRISEYYDTSNGHVAFELPNLVIIVDEFADLILTRAGKEIESNICRLAGKARAAGVHMVIATQRPSVDVITGLIKSNFPTRVSFRVTTSIDSRTILNAMGAEKLLGKGDMLYKSGVDTIRVHSSYVDEDEIEALTSKLSEIEPEFNSDAIGYIESGGENGNDADPYAYGSHISSKGNSGTGEDVLFDQAVSVVMEYRAASASMLQRRLKIGYNRAANLIEQLEERGIVGPAQGSKPRKVLGAAEQSL